MVCYCNAFYTCENFLLVPSVFHPGALGVDFSSLEVTDINHSLGKVSRGLLQHGVTAYCPTLVTSSREYYRRVIPLISPKKGGSEGAAVLGEAIVKAVQA